jgi:hypothetical protein
MMFVSCETVSALTARDRAGTSGETPPCPFSPWHWAQANWAKACSPAATFGVTLAVAPVVLKVPTVLTRLV